MGVGSNWGYTVRADVSLGRRGWIVGKHGTRTSEAWGAEAGRSNDVQYGKIRRKILCFYICGRAFLAEIYWNFYLIIKNIEERG